jgi:hypothetical protein
MREDEKVHAQFWSQNLKGGDHSEDMGIGGKIILEWILGKLGGKVWLRIGTNGKTL